jgi:hypothetical protein
MFTLSLGPPLVNSTGISGELGKHEPWKGYFQGQGLDHITQFTPVKDSLGESECIVAISIRAVTG